ncbi:MAG: alpha/beta fold hydrolase [archaeon]
MQSELVRIYTKDKLELQGLLFEPKIKSSKAVVHIHGWVGNFYENRFIDKISAYLLEKNIAFLTINTRGAGIITEFLKNKKKEKIGGSLEKFEESIYDIDAALDFLTKRRYSEFILQGHSLGCQKIVYYVFNQKDIRIKCLVMLAPVDDAEFASSLFNKKKYNEAIKIAKDMISEGKGQEPVPQWMQYYPMLSANMFIQVSDPTSTSARIIHTNGKLSELKSIKIPILAVFGSKDDYQKNPNDKLKALEEKTKCETLLIKDANHWFSGTENLIASEICKWILNK